MRNIKTRQRMSDQTKPKQAKTSTYTPLRSHQQVGDTFSLKMDEVVKE